MVKHDAVTVPHTSQSIKQTSLQTPKEWGGSATKSFSKPEGNFDFSPQGSQYAKKSGRNTLQGQSTLEVQSNNAREVSQLALNGQNIVAGVVRGNPSRIRGVT